MAIDTTLQIDLYKSINSLFYLSWISGVLPYSMSAYNRLKQFQTSIFSIGYSIVMTVHIVLEYHFAAKEFAWGDSSQSGKKGSIKFLYRSSTGLNRIFFIETVWSML